MATYTFNIHTPESKRLADAYFKVGEWYYSDTSKIIAQYSSTEKNRGVWMGAGGTYDVHIRMLSVHEWIPATQEQVNYALKCINKQKNN